MFRLVQLECKVQTMNWTSLLVSSRCEQLVVLPFVAGVVAVVVVVVVVVAVVAAMEVVVGIGCADCSIVVHLVVVDTAVGGVTAKDVDFVGTVVVGTGADEVRCGGVVDDVVHHNLVGVDFHSEVAVHVARIVAVADRIVAVHVGRLHCCFHGTAGVVVVGTAGVVVGTVAVAVAVAVAVVVAVAGVARVVAVHVVVDDVVAAAYFDN